jgi:hypothetical protein
VHRDPEQAGRQDRDAGDPGDVPEASDHAGERAKLSGDLGGLDQDRPAHPTAENATTQILADRSSVPAVRNGWMITTPMPISAP